MRVKSLRWNCPSERGSARPSGKSGNYGRKSLSWEKVAAYFASEQQ